VLLAALIAGPACAHKPAKKPAPALKEVKPCEEAEKLTLILDGAPNLNRGPDGQPLSTVVRIYQLKSVQRIQNISLDELIRSEKDALADDLLDTKEVTLAPLARIFPELPRKPEATHVAIAAFFRRPTGSSWRALAALPPRDPDHCHRPWAKRWIQFFLQGYEAAYVP
jgi:type VI secretion system VasD/TssJ family lipoprotein